jgi:hypothetical protein
MELENPILYFLLGRIPFTVQARSPNLDEQGDKVLSPGPAAASFRCVPRRAVTHYIPPLTLPADELVHSQGLGSHA